MNLSLTRIDDTKNMWAHMNSATSSPEALCAQSSRAGHRLLRARSPRPTPRMIRLLESMNPLCFAAPHLDEDRGFSSIRGATKAPDQAYLLGSESLLTCIKSYRDLACDN